MALRAMVAACAELPVCSSSSPSSSQRAALFGSSRSARSSEARAAGKLPAARCARLCSSSAPLAPLASLCGRAAGTSRGGSERVLGCGLGGGNRDDAPLSGSGRPSPGIEGAGDPFDAGGEAGGVGRGGGETVAQAAASVTYASNAPRAKEECVFIDGCCRAKNGYARRSRFRRCSRTRAGSSRSRGRAPRWRRGTARPSERR